MWGIRKVFRYKVPAMCFVGSLLVMFVVLMGGIEILNMAQAKEEERLDAMYKNRIEIEYSSFIKDGSDIDMMISLVDEGNLILNDRRHNAYNNARGTYFNPEVILVANEPMKYKLESGSLPGSYEDYPRQVAIGRNKKDIAKEIDGEEYIEICNELYKVTGWLGSSESDYWDNMVVLDWNYLGSMYKNALCKAGGGKLVYGSETIEGDAIKKSYSEWCGSMLAYDTGISMQGTFMRSTGQSVSQGVIDRSNIDLNMIVYVFCVINCVVISELWFMFRRKEIGIRKACGQSNMAIAKILACDIIGMMLTAAGIFVLLYVIFNAVFVSSFGVAIRFNYVTFAGVIITGIVVTLVSIALPMYKCFRLQPSEAIK